MSVGTPLDALDCFHASTRDWFAQAFEQPTRVQREAWPTLAEGMHALLLALPEHSEYCGEEHRCRERARASESEREIERERKKETESW